MSTHQTELEQVMGDVYRKFSCSETDRFCQIKLGNAFEYCPFCQQELD